MTSFVQEADIEGKLHHVSGHQATSRFACDMSGHLPGTDKGTSSLLNLFCRTIAAHAAPHRAVRKGANSLPPHRSVVIEPISANRLLENGNFCGLGWRLSADSR
jgi:hypothetical protein